MKLKEAIFVVLISLTCVQFAHSDVYKRETKLPPIRLTYEDVNQILKSFRSQLPSSQVTHQSRDVWQRGEITGIGDVTVKKEGNFLFTKDDRLPIVSWRFWYSYSNSKGLITEVAINLGDTDRTLSVEGISPDHVDATFVLLRDRLEKKATSVGGQTFRFIGFWSLYLMALAPIFIGIGSSRFSLITRTTMVAVGVLIIICLLVLPFREWFPGFAIYADSASFIVRNSAELTFAGVLLSIFGTALGIFFSYKFSLKKDKKKETTK